MATESITDTLATAYTISTTTTSTDRQTPTATYIDSAATSTIAHKTVTTPAISPPSADLLLEDPNPGFDTPALDKQRRHVTNCDNPNVSLKNP